MSCESYDLRLTTLSPIHIGSGKSYSCCEFVPAKAKSKGQIVKIIKRVNLTNYYSSLSDDRKDTFLASLTNSNFELKQFDKKIKKDFVRYQCIDNSRVDFINEVQEHIKTSDKLYIPGSSIKGAIRTAIFYDLLTEDDMDKIGKDISSNRRNNSFLSNDLLKKHFTSGFGNDAQYNIFRFMQVADTTTTNLPRIEQVLAVMATDDRRKNQFYSRHGKVVKSYLETIGANKNLELYLFYIFDETFMNFEFNEFSNSQDKIPLSWNLGTFNDIIESLGSGDWGKDELTGNYTSEVYCIRGADIPDVKQGNKGKMPIRYILSKNFQNKKLNENTIVLEISGGSPTQSTGRTVFITEDFLNRFDKDLICTNFCKVIKPALNYEIFIYLYFNYLYDKDMMFAYENGTTGIKNFDIKSFINNFLIVIPSQEDVINFNKLVKDVFDILMHNGLEIEKLQQLKDTLLPKLMSGEIDVSKINCDLELKYNYMKYLFNQIHKQLSKSVV